MTKVNYITVTSSVVAPVANFNAIPRNGTAPLTVNFTDLTTNGPTKWNWTFGDGSTTNSTVMNPVHTYANMGNYTVSLNATNSAGSNTLTRVGYINVSQAPPAANFSATPRNGTLPLTVKFTDLSTNTPVSWNWTFGDGSTANSTLKNPVHVYLTPGNFTVSLNATNSGGSNISVKTGYINVTLVPLPPPTATANTPLTGYRNTTVAFTLTGTNFQPGFTTVEFRNQSTAVITANLTSVTATLITGNVTIPANASLGLWNIRIVTVSGGETTRLNAFTVATQPAPTLTSITPVSANRNTTVNYSIVGTNFELGLTTVTFTNATGSVLNSSITSATTTRINGTLVINNTRWVGAYNVNISTADGGSTPGTGRFSVTQLGAPTLTTITPTIGYLNSTVSYTIVGTNFEPGLTTVVFKNATGAILNASSVTSVTATQINGTLPINSTRWVGAYNVNITTADGGSTPGTGRFSVALPLPPTLTSITPAIGYLNTTVNYTIVGTNFVPGQTTVVFKNATGAILNASSITNVTATRINGTLLINSTRWVGAYNVNISTINGGSTPGTARFTVATPLPPTLTSITPAIGYLNTTVNYTIVGTNFIPGQTTVVFKNATGAILNASSVTSVTATQINGTLLINSTRWVGAYNVNISTINGGSTPGTARFTVATPLPPTLTSITPAIGYLNTTVYYSIVGTNFIPGQTTVVFKNATGAILNASSVTSVTATQINGTLLINSTRWVGAYNVNISTINGGSTPGTSRFTVATPLPPTLTSITPAIGYLNTTVYYSIVGTNFIPGQTTVVFKNATGAILNASSVTSVTTTRINGTLLINSTRWVGAYNVNISTINGGSTPGTSRFSVAKPLAPTLTTITPAIGYQNTTVNYVIVGTNFIPGQTTVVFKNATGGVLNPTTLTSVTTTQINGTIVIPSRPWLGAYNVNISTIDGGSTPGTSRFTVSKFPTPTITSFTPATAYRNTLLSYTVVGTNFQPGLTTVNLTRNG